MDSSAITKTVTKILDGIIDAHFNQFRKNDSFKVRPGYGYDKFYLDSIDGSYDMSLQGLIHYIMYEEGIYREILSNSQYADVVDLIEENPEAIYRLDLYNVDDEKLHALQDKLDGIYAKSIKHVAKKLMGLGFDVEETFSGYL